MKWIPLLPLLLLLQALEVWASRFGEVQYDQLARGAAIAENTTVFSSLVTNTPTPCAEDSNSQTEPPAATSSSNPLAANSTTCLLDIAFTTSTSLLIRTITSQITASEPTAPCPTVGKSEPALTMNETCLKANVEHTNTPIESTSPPIKDIMKCWECAITTSLEAPCNVSARDNRSSTLGLGLPSVTGYITSDSEVRYKMCEALGVGVIGVLVWFTVMW